MARCAVKTFGNEVTHIIRATMPNLGGPIFDLINGISQQDWTSALVALIVIVVILLIAFPFHELAHAVVADKLGDDTPRLAGRLTLNPIKHLDPLGAVLFLVLGFGWATTPINPLNFRGNWRAKNALVAIAGPIANILLAIIFALIFRVLSVGGESDSFVIRVIQLACFIAVSINLLLAFFNLIPVPPLDGSKIFAMILPPSAEAVYWQIAQFGWIIILLLSQIGFISRVIRPLVDFFQQLLLGTTF
jgi:Zn-dependent protease